jgi:uncharacterized protein
MSGIALLAGAVAIAATLYVVVAIVVAHLFTTPRRMQTAEHEGLAYERIEFNARGESLQLVASYRRTEGATGAVILAHGRDSCRGDELRGTTRALVLELVARGLSVILIDLRGHGESAHARLTFGRREQFDILGAVDVLLRRGYRPGSIGILGASMGGASAIAAAVDEHAIGALVTDSAFASLHEVLATQFTRLTRLPTCVLGGALLAARVLTGENLLGVAPRVNMERMRGRPTLVIHAADDPFVPSQHARDLALASRGTIWITPGHRHLSSFAETGTSYLERVGDFFAQHLHVTPENSATAFLPRPVVMSTSAQPVAHLKRSHTNV